MDKSDDSEQKSKEINMASSFTAGIMSVMDSAVQSIDNASKKITEFAEKQANPQNQTNVEASVREPVVEETKPVGIHFCSNCGQKLQEGSKFCHGCGQKVDRCRQQHN